jgi:hypothetical protein
MIAASLRVSLIALASDLQFQHTQTARSLQAVAGSSPESKPAESSVRTHRRGMTIALLAHCARFLVFSILTRLTGNGGKGRRR